MLDFWTQSESNQITNISHDKSTKVFLMAQKQSDMIGKTTPLDHYLKDYEQ